MRWSQAFIPTLRDDPVGAEAVSHKLLVRGGFIRQVMAGVYTLLPAAVRVRKKVWRIIEEEMDAIGGQQFMLPTLLPSEPLHKTGRWDLMGEIMFQFSDRRDSEVALGVTHEEFFAGTATELTSYKQLPQIWYQIQTKYRDEPRPKSGLLRVREFTMKDSYSLDLDHAGLDVAFRLHDGAYRRIFQRFGLDVVAVAASSGAMGGSESVEFMVESDAGEDDVVRCTTCGYAANVERAVAAVPAIDDVDIEEPVKFPTPGIRTIAALEQAEGGAPSDRQIKTLVYVIDDEMVLVLLRGDHALQEQKLADATRAVMLRPASAEEVRSLVGADPGSLGAVGVSGIRILADHAITGRKGMTTGANEDDFHLRGVNVERDIAVTEWMDLRAVAAGEPCIECGTPLEVFAAIEVGHIFKLGTVYAETLGAVVLDSAGEQRPVVMGSYGIGLERNMAVVVEAHHDDKGIVWPVSVAPFEVVVTVLKLDDETLAAGRGLYDALVAGGIDAVIDDRDERAGVKFADAELIGIPFRITVGPRGLADGVVEVAERATGGNEEVALSEAAAVVADRIARARAPIG